MGNKRAAERASMPSKVPSSHVSPHASSSASQSLRQVAAFDLDGTLTRGDSLLPFLHYLSGHGRFARTMLRAAPWLTRYAVGLCSNHQAKNQLLQGFLQGYCLAELQPLAQRYATTRLWQRLIPAALARLRWHQQQGHYTVIVSASLELYLQPFAAQLGIDAVIATRLEQQQGVLSGYIHGQNCYGEEKRQRLQQHLQPQYPYVLHAYGDSRGDAAMLAMADYAYYRTYDRAYDRERLRPSPLPSAQLQVLEQSGVSATSEDNAAAPIPTPAKDHQP